MNSTPRSKERQAVVAKTIGTLISVLIFGGSLWILHRTVFAQMILLLLFTLTILCIWMED